MQRETLQKLPQGHQGIQRCRLRAQYSVWWTNITQRIEDLIERCHICVQKNIPHSEPLIPTPLPEYPWQKVASDMFVLNGDSYLIIVDYFSRYLEVIKLKSTTSRAITEAMKAVFSRHGIPETVVSDNGPQYSAEEFAKFAAEYNFHHVTSNFPQSNGQAERMVQTWKMYWRNHVTSNISVYTITLVWVFTGRVAHGQMITCKLTTGARATETRLALFEGILWTGLLVQNKAKKTQFWQTPQSLLPSFCNSWWY